MGETDSFEDKLSGRQEGWATFLAVVLGIAACATMIWFGFAVWNKALLRHSHQKWHLTTGQVADSGRVVAVSHGGFEAYEEATIRYLDWHDVSRTVSAKLPVVDQKGTTAKVCVRRTGQTYVSADYSILNDAHSSNPCRPGQVGPILGSIAIGIVLSVVVGVLSFMIITALMVAVADAASDGWIARKVRAANLKRSVRYRTSTAYRLLHGRRPQYTLVQAEAFLAELEGMKTTPHVKELRAKTRKIITELKHPSGRQKVDRVTEIDNQLDEISSRLDREREKEGIARTQTNQEMAERELG